MMSEVPKFAGPTTLTSLEDLDFDNNPNETLLFSTSVIFLKHLQVVYMLGSFWYKNDRHVVKFTSTQLHHDIMKIFSPIL